MKPAETFSYFKISFPDKQYFILLIIGEKITYLYCSNSNFLRITNVKIASDWDPACNKWVVGLNGAGGVHTCTYVIRGPIKLYVDW